MGKFSRIYQPMTTEVYLTITHCLGFLSSTWLTVLFLINEVFKVLISFCYYYCFIYLFFVVVGKVSFHFFSLLMNCRTLKSLIPIRKSTVVLYNDVSLSI